jgi:hypothetical protein
MNKVIGLITLSIISFAIFTLANIGFVNASAFTFIELINGYNFIGGMTNE